jgi:DNA-binding NarL/FixJ family response regulator
MESQMASAAEAPLALKPRQQDVLFYVCKGMRNAEIGALMGLSERTIKMYVRQLFEIFEVTNRTELAGLNPQPQGTSLNEGTCTNGHSH